MKTSSIGMAGSEQEADGIERVDRIDKPHYLLFYARFAFGKADAMFDIGSEECRGALSTCEE
jgi:hypothetical protein